MMVSTARRVLSRYVGAYEIRCFLTCGQVNRTEMHQGFIQTVDAVHEEAQTTRHAAEVCCRRSPSPYICLIMNTDYSHGDARTI